MRGRMRQLNEELREGRSPDEAAAHALRDSGSAILITTLVLVIGFVSMLSSELLALRDMGLVAAATLTIACLADLTLAPALFLVSYGRERS